MSTLKGLFEPKSRCQRNFLLENKRDVKAKSTSNKEKNNSSNQVPLNMRVSARSFPPQSASLERPKFSSCKNNSKSFHCSKTESDLKPPDSMSLECKRPDKPVVMKSAKTAHYIHQENVPFQWTEVCPSLISHNLCHQGVQTEENNCETATKKLESFSAQEISLAEFNGESCQLSNTPTATEGNSQPTTHIHSNVGFPAIPDIMSENIHGMKTHGSFETEDDKDNGRKHLLKKHLPKETSSSKTSPHSQSYPSSYQKGEIPRYLSKRKTEQALASARAKEVDPNCPPGHVAMSDTERRETLDMILKNYNELITELNKIPVRTDTLKMKQRKIEMEKQLDKLEEGMRIFSRSKVYVKVD